MIGIRAEMTVGEAMVEEVMVGEVEALMAVVAEVRTEVVVEVAAS